MAGSMLGTLFRVSTFGESHGPALGCVIDGCPPGLPLAESDIQGDLDRRRPGQSRYTTQRRESDTVEILSGVFKGNTTGAPIALLIRNEDQRPRDYQKIRDQFRPGHADFTYLKKYGLRDYRGSGRASARETVARVASGAVARKLLLDRAGIRIRGCMSQIGDIEAESIDWTTVPENPFFFPDAGQVDDIAALIVRRVEDTAAREGLRLLQSTLLEEVTDAPDSDGGSELSIAETGAGAAASGGEAAVPAEAERLRSQRRREAFS